MKRYLGDGVYGELDGHGILLTTENGISITNSIFLEPEVLAEFERFVNDLRRRAKEDEAAAEKEAPPMHPGAPESTRG